MIVSSAKV